MKSTFEAYNYSPYKKPKENKTRGGRQSFNFNQRTYVKI